MKEEERIYEELNNPRPKIEDATREFRKRSLN
jgi:hypothetical protein